MCCQTIGAPSGVPSSAAILESSGPATSAKSSGASGRAITR
jgi:hypothetical protein